MIEQYTDLKSAIEAAGYFTTFMPIEKVGDRMVCASHQYPPDHDRQGLHGNSFWVAVRSGEWFVASWAPRIYRVGCFRTPCARTPEDLGIGNRGYMTQAVNNLDAKHFLLAVRLAREEIAAFDRYPFDLAAVRTLDTLVLHPQVTFLVGENGSGKSTLIEAIAVGLGLNAEGGSRNFKFSTRASHSELHQFLRLRRGIRRPRDCFFLRAESYFNLATEIESLDAGGGSSENPCIIESYGNHSLHEQSHGESFFALFHNRFFGNGLYLLDEPEAALSPMRQMSFLSKLHQLVTDGSQLIIATHSPIIMAYPNAWIYAVGEEGVRRIEYKQTEHYKVTRDFLMRTERMLGILMEQDQSGGLG